jgi:tetratricopeptide (TPR) repeat protein
VGIEAVEAYSLGMVEVNSDSLFTYIEHKSRSCGEKLEKGCNDLVIAHLYAKDFPTALALSLKLIAKFPNDYNVVITHAAALELNGKPTEAIPFMERALALNPKSHSGSEWIHLNLLKQRAKGSIDPWGLIGVDLRPGGELTKPAGSNLEQLMVQVHYQVNDRGYFTPSSDPLFGALVFAYGDLLHLNGYKSQAKRMYEMAKDHGYDGPQARAASMDSVASPAPWEAKRDEAEAIPPALQKEKSPATFYGWAFVVAAAAGMTLFIWRNSKSAS